MIKHETLVVTKRAVEDLTAKYVCQGILPSLLLDNHRAQAGAKMHTFRLLHALHTTDVKEKMERSRDGPMQLELKMEKHRPVL